MSKLLQYKEADNQAEIVINNLSFNYSHKQKILKNINLIIKKNRWTTILGPNGSGKSTLAKLIVRINKIRHGKILLNNKNINSYSNKKYAQNVAYIPQMIDIPEGTSVYDYVAFGRNPWLNFVAKMSKGDHQIIIDALKKVRAYELKDKMIHNLSGGQRQKVIVAMAIAQTAQIIILDEPTTYLDIRAQYELLELMQQLRHDGKTIITVLHDINQALKYSDEVVVLKNGRVYDFDKPTRAINEKMLLEVFDIKGTLYHLDQGSFLGLIKLKHN